ncbi:hypothetical protein [Gottfriedia luciferensis]|uniref:hypothetical protein n=1 Tax=Gottfriedia luciferensis TaxID=178774 RepID=UPI000B42F4B2|nr:hypothetical protein [Gottfriedia luciferensis]
MNLLPIYFVSILILSAILIIITLTSLPQLGDERKKLIKMKSQSFTFTIVIALLVVEFGKEIYSMVWGSNSYKGISPFPFLAAISVVYLVSLLTLKKKYGD